MADYTLGLTAAEIDAVLQGVDNGSLLEVSNLTGRSAPQNFNINGDAANGLPGTTPKSYSVGEFFALNYEVTTAISDLERDLNGVLRASGGAFRVYKDQDPNATSLFGMVIDGSGNLYNAANTNGLTVGVDSGRDYIEVDWSLYNAVAGTDGIYIIGHTAQIGRIPAVSDNDSIGSVIPELQIGMTRKTSLTRTEGITYTNTSKLPIKVILGYTASGGNTTYNITIAGNVYSVSMDGQTNLNTAEFTVYPGENYIVTSGGLATLQIWHEVSAPDYPS